MSSGSDPKVVAMRRIAAKPGIALVELPKWLYRGVFTLHREGCVYSKCDSDGAERYYPTTVEHAVGLPLPPKFLLQDCDHPMCYELVDTTTGKRVNVHKKHVTVVRHLLNALFGS